MGPRNSKPTPCPFDEWVQARIGKAKSMRFIPGEASSFYFLCKDGKTDEVRQILDAKDSLPIEQLNSLQPNGSTALHAATFYKHLDIVQLLLEHGCPRTELNRFGNTAYDEAQTDEMKQLFDRYDLSDRFHETNIGDAISMFFPEVNNENLNVNGTNGYVHLFQTKSEIFEYSLNQETTAMWLNFYNWFLHTFRTFIEREDLHIDAFDLHNHPDFQEFLKQNLSDPKKYEKTMQRVIEAQRRNSIAPLINLYTREDAGFYRPFNTLLAQSAPNTGMSSHLCDRFIIEFHIHRQELKRRSFTGITYRGATMSVNDLVIYRHAIESKPPGVLGLKTFTSTSKDPLVALKFAFRGSLNEDQKHVLFIFKILQESSTIFGISDESEYKQEEEVLILPGNLFMVTKVEEQPNPPLTKIYLQHWKTSISFWKKIKQTIKAGKKSVLPTPVN